MKFTKFLSLSLLLLLAACTATTENTTARCPVVEPISESKVINSSYIEESTTENISYVAIPHATKSVIEHSNVTAGVITTSNNITTKSNSVKSNSKEIVPVPVATVVKSSPAPFVATTSNSISKSTHAVSNSKEVLPVPVPNILEASTLFYQEQVVAVTSSNEVKTATPYAYKEASSACIVVDLKHENQDLFSLINEFRKENNLPALTLEPRATEVIDLKVVKFVEYNSIDTTGKYVESTESLFNKNDVDYFAFYELSSMDSEFNSQYFRDILKNENIKRKILDPKFNSIAIAIRKSEDIKYRDIVLLATPKKYSDKSHNDKITSTVNLVNTYRVQNGLKPLYFDSSLNEVALLKGKDMVSNNYFGHHSPVLGSIEKTLDSKGVLYIHAGENLASGHMFGEDAFHSWLTSPENKNNILNKNFSRVGLAVVDNGQPIWVMIFVGR